MLWWFSINTFLVDCSNSALPTRLSMRMWFTVVLEIPQTLIRKRKRSNKKKNAENFFPLSLLILSRTFYINLLPIHWWNIFCNSAVASKDLHMCIAFEISVYEWNGTMNSFSHSSHFYPEQSTSIFCQSIDRTYFIMVPWPWKTFTCALPLRIQFISETTVWHSCFWSLFSFTFTCHMFIFEKIYIQPMNDLYFLFLLTTTYALLTILVNLFDQTFFTLNELN